MYIISIIRIKQRRVFAGDFSKRLPVSKGGAFGRSPQGAKHFYGVRSEKDKFAKESGGLLCGEGKLCKEAGNPISAGGRVREDSLRSDTSRATE